MRQNEKAVEHFLHSWIDFRLCCEIKAKNKARLNKECWKKLMIFHTEKFLSTQENPFSVLFYMRYRNPSFYRYYKFNMFYCTYLENRDEFFKRKEDERRKTTKSPKNSD